MTLAVPAKIGIYGGTFNPIHLGHLRAVEEVTERLGLDRMIFVPSARPPHKQADDCDPIAPAALRLAWVQEAVAGNPRFEVDSIEADRAGPSYLVDTLRAFRGRLGDRVPVFTLGCDAFLEIDTWRDPQTLLALANFAVTTRPPIRPEGLGEWLSKEENLYQANGNPRWVEHPALADKVDVVALPLTELSDVGIYPYDPVGGPDIVVNPAETISVVGFPFGLQAGEAL